MLIFNIVSIKKIRRLREVVSTILVKKKLFKILKKSIESTIKKLYTYWPLAILSLKKKHVILKYVAVKKGQRKSNSAPR